MCWLLVGSVSAAEIGGAGADNGNVLSGDLTVAGGTITVDDSATTPPLNLTVRSSAPSSPASGDIYLDDGTNCDGGSGPCLRRYTGTAWEDVDNAGSSVSRWVAWTGAARTDNDTITSTTHYEAGTPIRFRATAGTWRYAILTARSTDAHDFDGHPCTTSDDDEFQVGSFPGDQVKVINLVLPGNCSVADPFSARVYWQQQAAYLVRTTAIAGTASVGSALTLNTEVNDADAHSSEVSISAGSTSQTDSGVNITSANYDIQFGEAYHVSTSQCGSSTPGGNPLTVTLTFIVP